MRYVHRGACVLTLALSACLFPNEPHAGLDLEVTLDPAEVEVPTDLLGMTLTIRNRTPYVRSYVDCLPYTYEIRDTADVLRASGRCGGRGGACGGFQDDRLVPMFTVGPRDSVVVSTEIHLVAGVNPERQEWMWWTPGTYTIMAVLGERRQRATFRVRCRNDVDRC